MQEGGLDVKTLVETRIIFEVLKKSASNQRIKVKGIILLVRFWKLLNNLKFALFGIHGLI